MKGQEYICVPANTNGIDVWWIVYVDEADVFVIRLISEYQIDF